MTKEIQYNNKLERFGFSYERGGVHTARTMMLAELRALLPYVDKADAPKTEYFEAIQTANCLGKRSGKTRAWTFRHLADLYALDPNLALFRALRFFWQRDVDGQPYWRPYARIHMILFSGHSAIHSCVPRRYNCCT